MTLTSLALALIGLALLARGALAGSAVGVVIGLLFLAVGGGRLYLLYRS